MINDKRALRNLYNGNPKSSKYKDIWLTFFIKYPVQVKQFSKNIISVEFQKPVSISLINFYNYTKSWRRAVKEIEIYVDNQIIYTGTLNDPRENNLSTVFFSKF